MMKTSNISIDTNINYTKWLEANTNIEELIYKAIDATFIYTETSFENNCEISILLTDDKTIRQLNKDYRNIDKATNVLSFPMQSNFHEINHFILGDLIFSFDYIKQESIDEDKSFIDHFTHMIVHGTLHLLGYDHIDEDEAKKMEKIEIQILKKLKISNPYK